MCLRLDAINQSRDPNNVPKPLRRGSGMNLKHPTNVNNSLRILVCAHDRGLGVNGLPGLLTPVVTPKILVRLFEDQLL